MKKTATTMKKTATTTKIPILPILPNSRTIIDCSKCNQNGVVMCSFCCVCICEKCSNNAFSGCVCQDCHDFVK
jgi:hypothetical protein